MQAYLTLTQRELAAFFVSLAGYVIIALAVFQMGLSFVILLDKLNAEATPMPMTELFYITPFFWLILLFSAPVITMRLFAQEKASGTYETLMTAPVRDWQVVLAKFTAAMVFHLLMWVPLLICIVVLHRYTMDPGAMDYGAVAGTYLGIFLLGCLYMAIGCFASSLTRSQIIAAMITLAVGVTLFLLSFVSEHIPVRTTWVTETFRHINMIEHMQTFSRGMVDTRHVLFYVSVAAFFLFLTHRAVESRRWK